MYVQFEIFWRIFSGPGCVFASLKNMLKPSGSKESDSMMLQSASES